MVDTEKIQVIHNKIQMGYAIKYYERSLHNYFIPHRKYSGQHNQCDIRVAHDGKFTVANGILFSGIFGKKRTTSRGIYLNIGEDFDTGNFRST